MTFLQINRQPSRSELRWFGLILAAVLGVLGAVIAWRWSLPVGRVFWGAAVLIGIVYYAAPSLRRPIYVGWSLLTYPIGWVVSHLLLGIAYYLVLTPTGLVLRLLGRDAMRRRFEPTARSYWTPHTTPDDPERYFKQF